jgi:hypothetical protein
LDSSILANAPVLAEALVVICFGSGFFVSGRVRVIRQIFGSISGRVRELRVPGPGTRNMFWVRIVDPYTEELVLISAIIATFARCKIMIVNC